jgi:neutral ceramidase
MLLAVGAGAAKKREARMWKAGIARTIITPEQPLFLSGYGSRRPSEGKRHELWAKALALEDRGGRTAVLVTTDLVGVSKAMYERLAAAVQKRHGLKRSQFLLTYTHNHCAPVTTDVLPDYYPFGPEDWRPVDEYSRRLEDQILETVREALSRMGPARLSAGEGTTTFAVNRRDNREAEVPELLARGEPLKGRVDHSVPVLAVHGKDGALLAAVFGYACHPTTLSDNHWCGDYPGYAQIEVEKKHPGAAALFWTGCGGDQNPLPRRTVALCEKYGGMLAGAVEETLAKPLRPVSPELRTAFEMIRLDFDRRPTREELEADAQSTNSVRARWAKRMLQLLGTEHRFPDHCDYGVQAWRLGDDQLWVALGGEAVVDYSLRFKQEYGPHTWVAGYAHDMVGYVPSRRVWKEGGYEAEYIYEYGWLAYRWTEDTEDRIAAAVQRLVSSVKSAR